MKSFIQCSLSRVSDDFTLPLMGCFCSQVFAGTAVRSMKILNAKLWQGMKILLSIQIFAPQWKQSNLLANNDFFCCCFVPLSLSLSYPQSNLRHLEVSEKLKGVLCCVFNRAAQFNPTLTLKAQGLIPSLVKAFVWGSPSRLAAPSLSLACPSKSHWQIFTQVSFLKKVSSTKTSDLLVLNTTHLF